MSENTSESPGEREDTVVVSRTVSVPVREVWKVLMTDQGTQALLGPGATLGAKGHAWTSDDGRMGVIRSFHPLEEIRFSFRKSADSAPGMVELLLVPQGESTTLQITHRNFVSEVEWIQHRWSTALERIEACLDLQGAA